MGNVTASIITSESCSLTEANGINQHSCSPTCVLANQLQPRHVSSDRVSLGNANGNLTLRCRQSSWLLPGGGGERKGCGNNQE